jgi:hypothetical protein
MRCRMAATVASGECPAMAPVSEREVDVLEAVDCAEKIFCFRFRPAQGVP